MDPKVQQFLQCFKNNAFTACFGLKFLLKKHVSKLLQGGLVCPSLIPPLLPLCCGQSVTIAYNITVL